MPDWAERKSSIVYHCPDIEAAMDKLAQRGVKIIMELGDLPWGTFAAIEDLDGTWIGLTDMPIAMRPMSVTDPNMARRREQQNH